jgi:hypothetical protein
MTATAPEYNEIVRVVQLYIDGFNDCDVDKFREAFDEDAWIFYTDPDGCLHRYLLADEFADWASPPRAKIAGRFISVTQAGEVACVLLGFDDLSNASDPAHRRWDSWVDFHTLLRIDGVWKITNKTATHATRAGWAGDRLAGRPAPAVA